MEIALERRINVKGTGGGNRVRRQNLQGSGSEEQSKKNSKPELSYLDLFSTSQTKHGHHKNSSKNTDRRIYDECTNNAPYFAYQIEGKKWGVVQGCCNDWTCPRCGQQRAREEYGRIVAGAREVGKNNELYLLTITCRGRELTYEQAQNGYLEWTNRLLTRLRTSTKRLGGKWYYAAVTERQTRGHPHSHFITTFSPADQETVKKGEGKTYFTSGEVFPAKHNTIQSKSLERACVECGLGRQYDISRIESFEAASRYVAKYLFKETIFETIWPVGWRRVRYSQNWPRLPEIKSDAMLLLTNEDWNNLARKALIINTKDDGAKEMVRRKLSLADVIIQ
jgi:hypothetical protein